MGHLIFMSPTLRRCLRHQWRPRQQFLVHEASLDVYAMCDGGKNSSIFFSSFEFLWFFSVHGWLNEKTHALNIILHWYSLRFFSSVLFSWWRARASVCVLCHRPISHATVFQVFGYTAEYWTLNEQCYRNNQHNCESIRRNYNFKTVVCMETHAHRSKRGRDILLSVGNKKSQKLWVSAMFFVDVDWLQPQRQ